MFILDPGTEFDAVYRREADFDDTLSDIKVKVAPDKGEVMDLDGVFPVYYCVDGAVGLVKGPNTVVVREDGSVSRVEGAEALRVDAGSVGVVLGGHVVYVRGGHVEEIIGASRVVVEAGSVGRIQDCLNVLVDQGAVAGSVISCPPSGTDAYGVVCVRGRVQEAATSCLHVFGEVGAADRCRIQATDAYVGEMRDCEGLVDDGSPVHAESSVIGLVRGTTSVRLSDGTKVLAAAGRSFCDVDATSQVVHAGGSARVRYSVFDQARMPQAVGRNAWVCAGDGEPLPSNCVGDFQVEGDGSLIGYVSPWEADSQEATVHCAAFSSNYIKVKSYGVRCEQMTYDGRSHTSGFQKTEEQPGQAVQRSPRPAGTPTACSLPRPGGQDQVKARPSGRP